MALTNLQQKIESENTIGALSFMYLLSLAITVVTCVIDVILEMVFEIFKKWEKHTNWTNYYLCYSVKTKILQYILLFNYFFEMDEVKNQTSTNYKYDFIINDPINKVLNLANLNRKI